MQSHSHLKRWAKQTVGVGSLVVLTTFMWLSFFTISATSVHAEEVSGSSDSSFNYTAKKCDNLTILVRNALMRFDKSKDDVELSNAQIVFAETNIVQQLGSYHLAIGQEVDIPEDLVEKYVNEAKQLSETQIAAWDVYAKRVDFSEINAESTQTTAEIKKAEEASKPENLDTSDTGTENKDTATDQEEAQFDWWWVALVGVTLAFLYYTLKNRDDLKVPPTDRKPNTKKRK